MHKVGVILVIILDLHLVLKEMDLVAVVLLRLVDNNLVLLLLHLVEEQVVMVQDIH